MPPWRTSASAMSGTLMSWLTRRARRGSASRPMRRGSPAPLSGAADTPLRHRRGGATVTLRIEQQRPGRVRLIVEAQPTGFWPEAWRSLSERADHPATPLRLRTARHIVDACGGSLYLSSNAGCVCVHIDLPVACDV